MDKKFFSITILTPLFCIFFVINTLCIAQRSLKIQSINTLDRALRVKPIFNFNFETTRTEFKKTMLPLLEKNNIVFVDRNPDVILICGAPTKHMLTLKYPHIFLDEEESASISDLVRRSLRNPYTIAVFKNTTLRPKSLYNLPIKYHFKLIMDGFSASKKIKYSSLSQAEQQKMRSVLWDIQRSPFKNILHPLTEQIIDFETERPVDVFFAGTINENNPAGLHRALLMKKLRAMKQFEIITHSGRLPKEEYLDLLRASKIAVSPWGNGEWAWRDYEAMYSGAVVIKPDTSFVLAVPDLYRNNKYYVACKPDFSDLEEKIAYVLENYEKFTDMRKNARNLLLDHWNYQKIAQNLAHKLRQAFQNYNISKAMRKKSTISRPKGFLLKTALKKNLITS